MKINSLGSLDPNWEELQHAYGSASDVPAMLPMLTSCHQEQRQDAVNDLLYSRAYHQHDVFTVTPWVIRFAVGLLADETSSNLVVHRGTNLGDEIIHFCRICGEAEAATAEVTQQITAALIEGKSLFNTYVSSGRRQTVDDATWLVEFCEKAKL